jgi:SanA protein
MLPAASNGFRRHPWRWLGLLLALALIGDLLWILGRFPRYSAGRTFDTVGAPPFGAPCLILGAGVYSDGEPTEVLEGRLSTALSLWRSGKASWFLVSGDNRTPSYNEPLAMRRWLLRQGVPSDRIIADFAGRRTYASLKRARTVFGLERVVLVTSDFHMPRALFLADKVGLTAWGVPADTRNRPFGTRVSLWTRETVARHVAVLDGWFPPAVVLGPREATPEDQLGPSKP